jgi:hypothetical protein
MNAFEVTSEFIIRRTRKYQGVVLPWLYSLLLLYKDQMLRS